MFRVSWADPSEKNEKGTSALHVRCPCELQIIDTDPWNATRYVNFSGGILENQFSHQGQLLSGSGTDLRP